MVIARSLLDEIVAHAREEAPNECCGMVAGGDGRAERVYRTRNAAASPLRYEVDPQDQFRVLSEIEDEGLDLTAIYHSHTRSAPEPSQTDINLARNWPDPVYLIAGIAGDEPDVRAWRITGERVESVPLTVEE